MDTENTKNLYKFDVSKAIGWIIEEWENLSGAMIYNCWCKTGLIGQEEYAASSHSESEEDEVENLYQQISKEFHDCNVEDIFLVMNVSSIVFLNKLECDVYCKLKTALFVWQSLLLKERGKNAVTEGFLLVNKFYFFSKIRAFPFLPLIIGSARHYPPPPPQWSLHSRSCVLAFPFRPPCFCASLFRARFARSRACCVCRAVLLPARPPAWNGNLSALAFGASPRSVGSVPLAWWLALAPSSEWGGGATQKRILRVVVVVYFNCWRHWRRQHSGNPQQRRALHSPWWVPAALSFIGFGCFFPFASQTYLYRRID